MYVLWEIDRYKCMYFGRLTDINVCTLEDWQILMYVLWEIDRYKCMYSGRLNVQYDLVQ